MAALALLLHGRLVALAPRVISLLRPADEVLTAGRAAFGAPAVDGALLICALAGGALVAAVLLRCLLAIGRFFYSLLCAPTIYIPGQHGVPLLPELRPVPLSEHPCGADPPPFVQGWFRLCDSRDLLPGGPPKEAWLCDELLVAFRGASGAAHVLGAYCPHLGANLARGGRVRGEAITCPFHEWSFDGCSGRCVEVPYNPPGASVPAVCAAPRVVRDLNGMILVWYGHKDGGSAEPLWEPPNIAAVTSKRLLLHGLAEHTLSCHPSDPPENAADVAHLAALHSPLAVPKALEAWLGPLRAMLEHGWRAAWSAGDPARGQGHLGFVQVREVVRLKVGKAELPLTSFEVAVTQIGPGLVHWQASSLLGEIHVLASLTPRRPLDLTFQHAIYAPLAARLLAKLFFAGAVRQVPVWNSKRGVDRPPLAKGDGPIQQYRRWYRQFLPPRNLIDPNGAGGCKDEKEGQEVRLKEAPDGGPGRVDVVCGAEAVSGSAGADQQGPVPAAAAAAAACNGAAPAKTAVGMRTRGGKARSSGADLSW